MDVKDMLLQCKSNVFSKQYQCNYFIKVMILFFLSLQFLLKSVINRSLKLIFIQQYR